MFDLEKAIKFPTEDKDWQTKLGIYFVIIFSITALGWVLSLVLDAPIQFALSFIKEFVEEFKDYDVLSRLASTSVNFLNTIVTLPLQLYISGYIFETVRNIISNSKTPMPDHGKIWERIKLGSIRWLFSFLSSIPAFLVITVTAVLAVTSGFLFTIIPPVALIVVILTTLLGIFCLVAVILVSPMIKYAMEYHYLSGSTIGQSIAVNRVTETVSKNWKRFLALILADILGSIAVGLSLFACCLIFLVQPAIVTYVAFAKAYIYGKVYSEIKKG